MANLKGPLFSLRAQKQLGKSLIYKMKRSGAFLTKYNKPGGVNPFDASPAQLDKRMLYNLILARWQTMSDAQRLAYTTEAKSKNLQMSGWNLFYRYAINDLPTYLGLQGYWSFNKIVNGKVPDLSGNGNDGTPMPSYPDNAPQLVDGIGGKFGKAGSFDGTDDYVNCGNNPSLNITDAITIEAWVKRTGDGTIKASDNGNAYYGYSFKIISSKLNFTIVTFNGGILGEIDSINDVPTEWAHVAITKLGTDLRLYINGELDNSNSDGATIIYSSTIYHHIGRYSVRAGQEYYFNGAIDEVRIYNRALENPEILKHYELLPPQ